MADPLHPRPIEPPHSVARCFPGLQATGESDGIPLGCNQYFLCFSLVLAASVRLSEPPATIQMLSSDMQRGGIQPSQAQIEQGREEGKALRQMEKGGEERRGERSSCSPLWQTG